MVVSDSDQEDGTTQNVDLDALRALANAVMVVDSDLPSGSTSQIPAASLCSTTAVPPATSAIPPGASDAPTGALTVLPGALNVSATAASVIPADSPTVPVDVHSDDVLVHTSSLTDSIFDGEPTTRFPYPS
nr:hypothetical protein [Tanacetum cinerariifolium]